MTTVAVLGGGVGGLTAAHELADRGFDVTVLEWREAFGGKARSMDVPGSATAGRKPLPGEHGFRFFPGFYRHIPDTMSRIPNGDRTVFDHLVPSTRILLAQAGGRPEIVGIAERPSALNDFAVAIRFPAGPRHRRPRPAGRIRRLREVSADPAVRVRRAPLRAARPAELVGLHRGRAQVGGIQEVPRQGDDPHPGGRTGGGNVRADRRFDPVPTDIRSRSGRRPAVAGPRRSHQRDGGSTRGSAS